jgi:transcriptional regulator with XRE-family HTH domain
VPRLPPTPEDLARGERLKTLREFKKLKQKDLFPGNESKRAQVAGAENGRTKFQGPFLRELAKAFDANLEVFEAYLNGELSLERFLTGTALGQSGMGSDYHARKAREFEAKRVADSRVAGRTKVFLDPLVVINALKDLDGIPYERAITAAQEVQLEAGDTFSLYVAARLKLRAEAGGALPGERVLPGPDVADRGKPKKVSGRQR